MDILHEGNYRVNGRKCRIKAGNAVGMVISAPCVIADYANREIKYLPLNDISRIDGDWDNPLEKLREILRDDIEIEELPESGKKERKSSGNL